MTNADIIDFEKNVLYSMCLFLKFIMGMGIIYLSLKTDIVA